MIAGKAIVVYDNFVSDIFYTPYHLHRSKYS